MLCVSGISHLVMLVIAYLSSTLASVCQEEASHFSYLNFMGQLMEFEHAIQSHGPTQHLDISAFLPTSEQEKLSENVRARSS